MEKCILITDGREQATQALAVHLAASGFQVVVNDPSGGLCICPGCRITTAPLEEEEALQALVASMGPGLWGVIHPAPPLARASLSEGTEEDFSAAFSQGALAALHAVKVAGEALCQNSPLFKGKPAFVFLGSIHSEKPTGCAPFFSMNCSAVQMLCREAAQDLGSRGVSFHYVRRGVMEQDLSRKNSLSNVFAASALQYPDRQLPTAESLFPLFTFLFSGGAGILNGSDLAADGGMTQYYGLPLSQERLAQLAQQPHEKKPQEAFTHPSSLLSSPKGKVALITGGGKGVGAGVARVLCGAGVKACIGYNTNRALAEQTLEEITSAGGEAFLFQADVSHREELQGMVAETVARYGGIDILVNNAALQPNRFIQTYDDALFSKVWQINIGGYWMALQECLPYLKKSSCPRVVNISSIHSKRPTVFDPGYAMTKAAIRMFTREAALELGVSRITVNAINLGSCDIEGKTGDFPFSMTRPLETCENPGHLTEGIASPEDVGFLTLALIGPEAAHMTGSGIRLDNGSMLT